MGSTKEDVDSNKTSVTTQSKTKEDDTKSEKENLEDNIEISKSTEENIKVGKKMENVIINSREPSVQKEETNEVKELSQDICKEIIESEETIATRVSKEEANKIKEAISNAENLIKQKVAEKLEDKLPITKSTVSNSKSSSANVPRDQSTVNTSGSDSNKETPLENDKNIKSSQTKDDDVPQTPIVRRRGDTFTVVLPPPRGKPPPPPMSRPPPPPMSPPVPESKVKDLEKENKLIIVANKEPESESESEEEEESEWEWTEEEESESESECAIKKEGWENILSSSKGPTTFKAEYSVKI